MVGGVDFTNLKWVFAEATEETPEAALMYGQFIQNVVDFLIIAFCIFLMVKAIARLTKKKEEAPAPAPAPEPSAEEKLLTEIRDLLKDKK